jgi:outer membrane protein
MKSFYLVLSLLASSVTFAEIKIGYIDVQKAIQATKAGKAAKKKLEGEFKEKKQELQKKEADLRKMNEDLEKKKLVLSDEVRVKKQMQLQEEMLKYREQVGKSQMAIQVKERDLTKPIIEKMKKAMEVIAKKESLSIILERAEQSVVWADAKLDITDKVIKEFEKL